MLAEHNPWVRMQGGVTRVLGKEVKSSANGNDGHGSNALLGTAAFKEGSPCLRNEDKALAWAAQGAQPAREKGRGGFASA